MSIYRAIRNDLILNIELIHELKIKYSDDKKWLNITLRYLIVNVLAIKNKSYLNARKAIYIKYTNYFNHSDYLIIKDVQRDCRNRIIYNHLSKILNLFLNSNRSLNYWIQFTIVTLISYCNYWYPTIKIKLKLKLKKDIML